jgi:hypothetical protein
MDGATPGTGGSERSPVARTSFLLTEQVGDELLVYDVDGEEVCRLNQTAALVWRSSDGHHTVPELVTILAGELGDMADEDLVLVTLDRLHENGLIESGYTPRGASEERLSRRRFLHNVAAISPAVLVLPIVDRYPDHRRERPDHDRDREHPGCHPKPTATPTPRPTRTPPPTPTPYPTPTPTPTSTPPPTPTPTPTPSDARLKQRIRTLTGAGRR